MGIRYYLPETRVVVSGVIEQTATMFLPDTDPEITTSVLSTSIEWITAADHQWSADLNIDPKRMQDQLTKVSFTADRRLSSLTRNTSSRAVKVVKGIATIAGAAVSAGVLLDGTKAPEVDAARAGYDAAKPEESTELAGLRAQLKAARQQLRVARTQMLDAQVGDASTAAYRRVRQLEQVISQLEEDVDAAALRFKAWKASRTTTTSRDLEATFEMRHLPRWDGRQLDWDSAADSAPGHLGAEEIWESLHVAVARVTPPREPTHPEHEDSSIRVRMLRTEVFAIVRRDGPDDAPRVAEMFERAVLDDRSDTELVPLDERWFGKRDVAIEFDSDGVMIGLSRSDEGGVEDAIGAVKEGFAEGLAFAKTTVETVDSFTSRADAARQAQLERDVVIAQKEIELEGLGATRREAGELARLKQLAEFGDNYKSIGSSGASSIAALTAMDPSAMSWYRAPAPAPPPEPQVIRLEIVRPE